MIYCVLLTYAQIRRSSNIIVAMILNSPFLFITLTKQLFATSIASNRHKTGCLFLLKKYLV